MVDHKNCSRQTRPKLRRECINFECTAEWRTSAWSQCSKSCGGGIEMRTIGCYWRGTKKPAGNSCDGSERPNIIKSCNPQPCPAGLPLGPYAVARPPPVASGAGNTLPSAQSEASSSAKQDWEWSRNLLNWRGWQELNIRR